MQAASPSEPTPTPSDTPITPSPSRPWGQPRLSTEPHAAMAPYKSRGRWPSTGHYDQMRRAQPAVDGAMTSKYWRHQGRPWRALDPHHLDGAAVRRAALVRSDIYRLDLPLICAEVLDRCDQYGFCLVERLWTFDEVTLTHRLSGLVWVEPWQVVDWQPDASQNAVAVQIIGAGGVTPWVDLSRFALISRRGSRRVPEGHSALRSLYWRSEDVRRMLRDAAITRARLGPGKRKWKVPRADWDSTEIRAGIRQAGRDLMNPDVSDVIIPAEAEVAEDEGPRHVPDFREAIRSHEHSMVRVLGDPLSEEGVAVKGARAAAVEQRHTADLTEQGQCLWAARQVTRELVHAAYGLNGWPIDEAPHIWVEGWPDTDAWRALRELIAEDRERRAVDQPELLEDEDYGDIRDALRLAFGIGRDHA